MKTYILLLRAINVGGKNILPMKELTSLLLQSGFHNVETYIQSGNVVLNSERKPTENIVAEIENKFGFRPEILTIEKSQFELAIANNPFKSVERKLLHLYFPVNSLKPDTKKLLEMASTTERYEIIGSVFYLHAPDGIGRSKLVSNLAACLGGAVTGRNGNTVAKLIAMAQSASQVYS